MFISCTYGNDSRYEFVVNETPLILPTNRKSVEPQIYISAPRPPNYDPWRIIQQGQYPGRKWDRQVFAVHDAYVSLYPTPGEMTWIGFLIDFLAKGFLLYVCVCVCVWVGVGCAVCPLWEWDRNGGDGRAELQSLICCPKTMQL